MSPGQPSSDVSENCNHKLTRRAVLGVLATGGVGLATGCVADAGGGKRASDPTEPPTVARPAFSRERREESFRLSYRWRHDGQEWELDLAVPTARYRSATRANRSLPQCFSDATTNPLAIRIAAELSRACAARGVDSPLGHLRVALSFVHSLQYVADESATGAVEYPKYIEETLVDGGGDCEDLTALLAGVLAGFEFGFDPVLAVFPEHAGLGVDPSAVESDTPTVDGCGRPLLYLDAAYQVAAGTIPEPHASDGVLAVYDSRWHVCDPSALVGHVRESIDDGTVVDPRLYL